MKTTLLLKKIGGGGLPPPILQLLVVIFSKASGSDLYARSIISSEVSRIIQEV